MWPLAHGRSIHSIVCFCHTLTWTWNVSTFPHFFCITTTIGTSILRRWVGTCTISVLGHSSSTCDRTSLPLWPCSPIAINWQATISEMCHQQFRWQNMQLFLYLNTTKIESNTVLIRDMHDTHARTHACTYIWHQHIHYILFSIWSLTNNMLE